MAHFFEIFCVIFEAAVVGIEGLEARRVGTVV